MSCEDETADILRRAGHKMTPQRLLILRALRHAEGHISAAQITEQIREAYPFVDISTVYRTLDVLKRMKLVTQ
ncbi:MAG: Fur family transcriptional regulator, partial [Hyphomicrobiales bacterium]